MWHYELTSPKRGESRNEAFADGEACEKSFFELVGNGYQGFLYDEKGSIVTWSVKRF